MVLFFLNARKITSSMIFKDPTGVVMTSTLKQVQALHIDVQKQPLRNRLVSTNTDLCALSLDFMPSDCFDFLPPTNFSL